MGRIARKKQGVSRRRRRRTGAAEGEQEWRQKKDEFRRQHYVKQISALRNFVCPSRKQDGITDVFKSLKVIYFISILDY